MDISNVQSIAIAIDELRHEDVNVRVGAYHKLGFIAEALGPHRTRSELLPYVYEFIDDEDEVLVVLAETLASFLPYVGGAEYISQIFQPLEALAGAGEACVRDKAVESIISLSGGLDPSIVATHLFPLVRRLSQGEYTARISAAALCSVAYTRVNPDRQQDLRKCFTDLCKDPTPNVRRAACTQFGQLVHVMKYEDIKNGLLGAFTAMVQDDQDSVRLLSVSSLVSTLRVFRANGKATTLFPSMNSLFADKSWRVRCVVANSFPAIVAAVGGGHDQQLVEAFSKLLLDSEAEVRTAAAFKIGEIVQAVDPQVAGHLIQAVKAVAKDSCTYARAALGSVVTSFSRVLPKQDVMDHVLPIYLLLLKDADPEVRLHIISQIDAVKEVLTPEHLAQSLCPAIRALAHDRKWRNRLGLVGHLPVLATNLGKAFFEQELAEITTTFLQDPIFTVREAVIQALCKITDSFGIEWSSLHIVPKVLQLCDHSNYLLRVTALSTLKALAPSLGQDVVGEKCLPRLIELSRDPVPNVRFNVAKAFTGVIPVINPTLAEQAVQPCLVLLRQDTDSDVRYYAGEAFRGKEPRLNLGTLSIPSTPTILRVGSPSTPTKTITPIFLFDDRDVVKFRHDRSSPSKLQLEPTTPPRVNPKLRPG